MSDTSQPVQSADQLEKPVTIGREAYVSADYARAERERLWRKSWLQAGRVEDIPEPGNFITYDIMEDSVIILRDDDGGVRAFHNVCTHRGRRLVDTPRASAMRAVPSAFASAVSTAWTFNREGAMHLHPASG